jgi:hypothetical protein
MPTLTTLEFYQHIYPEYMYVLGYENGFDTFVAYFRFWRTHKRKESSEKPEFQA